MLSDEAGRPLGDINLIGVLPTWRGRGIGRALLQWGVAELRARGAARIELSVEAANERATGLYRAHGFRLAGLRRGYYRDTGEDALIMEWRGRGAARAART